MQELKLRAFRKVLVLLLQASQAELRRRKIRHRIGIGCKLAQRPGLLVGLWSRCREGLLCSLGSPAIEMLLHSANDQAL